MKNLTWREDVKKSPAIVRTAELLDPHFEGEPSIITSGVRTKEDQLALIMQKLAKHGKDREFHEFVFGVIERWPIDKTVHIDDINRDLYWWQRGWSRLLNIGEIINPPFPAEVMFDYQADGRNKKGEIIQISNHMRGLALDIGGADDIKAKAKCVLAAVNAGDSFIKGWRIEGVNNCVHIDVSQIG